MLEEPSGDSVAPLLARKGIADTDKAALTRRKEIIARVNACVRLTQNRVFSKTMVEGLKTKFDLSYLDAEVLLCQSMIWALSIADENSDV